MQDGRDGTTKTASSPNWPAIANPMVLLDELERRLDHCERVVTSQLNEIQARLSAMERDMGALHSQLSESRIKHEKQVVALADRLTRLEDRVR